MSVVVENGSVVEGANSYGDETGLGTYSVARGITITGNATTLLIHAMDSIESKNFIGDKFSNDQPLQWPRINVYIDGFLQDSDVIPQSLIEAQYETAIALNAGHDPLAATVVGVKRKKVYGAVEIEYKDNSSSAPIVLTINNKLSKLLKGNSGANQIRVGRA